MQKDESMCIAYEGILKSFSPKCSKFVFKVTELSGVNVRLYKAVTDRSFAAGRLGSAVLVKRSECNFVI